jgi:hypothetical protein
MGEFLQANWFWIVLLGLFIWMHSSGMGDEFRGKAVVLVGLRVGSRGHVGSPQAVRWLIRGSITSSLCHQLAGLTTSGQNLSFATRRLLARAQEEV